MKAKWMTDMQVKMRLGSALTYLAEAIIPASHWDSYTGRRYSYLVVVPDNYTAHNYRSMIDDNGTWATADEIAEVKADAEADIKTFSNPAMGGEGYEDEVAQAQWVVSKLTA